MHITINSFGSRGDIQPFIALGLGLKQAGHHVALLTHTIFEDFVRQYGLETFSIPLDPREVLVQNAAAELGNDPARMLGWMREHFYQHCEMLFRVTLDAARQADLLVNSTLSIAGYHVAQKLDLPVVAAYLQPVTPSRYLHASNSPPPPPWLPFKGVYNYLSNKLTNQAFFNLLLPAVNDNRRAILDLGPLNWRYYWRVDHDPGLPMLYAYSPSFLPPAPDWHPDVHVTGYWFLEQEAHYTPPDELLQFLESGSKPVYIGFGSMVDHEKESFMQLLEQALALVGARAVLLGGWSGLQVAQENPDILPIDFAPHEWLFPQMAAVVHHGGAGTTGAGLRAGVPQVIVPFFTDQFFWAWRVAHTGVGPPGLPRKGLTPERLAAALRQVLSDGEMQARAASLGESVRGEDGVARAVELIQRPETLRRRVLSN